MFISILAKPESVQSWCQAERFSPPRSIWLNSYKAKNKCLKPKAVWRCWCSSGNWSLSCYIRKLNVSWVTTPANEIFAATIEKSCGTLYKRVISTRVSSATWKNPTADNTIAISASTESFRREKYLETQLFPSKLCRLLSSFCTKLSV